MKKIVFLLIAFLVLLFFACKVKQNDDEFSNISIASKTNLESEQDFGVLSQEQEVIINEETKDVEQNEEISKGETTNLEQFEEQTEEQSLGESQEKNNNVDHELLQYKDEAKKEIVACYESLDINDYSNDAWNELKSISNSSNSLIDGQNSKEDVYFLKNKIICKIRSVSPKSLTYDFLLKSFDLDDEKEYWEETGDDEFPDNQIIVVLKRPVNYIELNIDCFELENAISIKYISGVIPPDYMFKSAYSSQLNAYRQIVLIQLESLGKEKLIEAIRILEQLEFVKYVSPDLALQPA